MDEKDGRFFQTFWAKVIHGWPDCAACSAEDLDSYDTAEITVLVSRDHFQVWYDKAGNAANITDGDLTFPDLNAGVDPNTGASGTNVADEFQTNLIMPEPTLFLSQKLGPVAIVRPTSTAQGGAVASVASFVEDGLFLDPVSNKNTGIVEVLMRLAEEADEGRRRF